MTKCDFGNSFIIPLGNGAWEINPLYKPTPDIASHCPQFTLSTSVNTKPDAPWESPGPPWELDSTTSQIGA